MNDIPTIDLRAELLDRHAGAIKGLYRLSTQIPIEKWALVGGMMVLVLAYEHDTHSWRASQTKDADIVVDVVADRTVLSATTQTLQAQGFTLDASVGSGDDVSRCTFSSYKSQIDVLCPSDATPDMLDTTDGLRSIAIPGGRRALRSARPVNLYIAAATPHQPNRPGLGTVPRRTQRPRPHRLRNTHPTITLTAGADHTAALGTTHRDPLLRALIDTLLTR